MKPPLIRPLSIALLLTPNLAHGSALPTSFSLRWTVGKEAGSFFWDFAHEPSVSMTWPLGRQFAVWSDLGYMRETTAPYDPLLGPVFGSSGNARDQYSGYRYEPVTYQTHFVPVTVGMRAYLQHTQTRSRGLYVEAGPTATFASYMTEDRDSRPAFLGGFRAGIGARFAGFDGSLIEAGMSYYLAESLGDHSDAVGSIGSPGVDLRVFGGYIAVGFGH